MAEITKKQRIRAGHKGVVTKKLGEVRALLEAGETSGDNPDTLKPTSSTSATSKGPGGNGSTAEAHS